MGGCRRYGGVGWGCPWGFVGLEVEWGWGVEG